MALNWKATYSDGTTVRSAACRWAELDRRRLARFAVYAHAYDISPALDIAVPIGYRIMQCVRNIQGKTLERFGIVALENADRSQVRLWTMDDAGIITPHPGYSPGLWEMEVQEHEEQVRTG